MNVWFVDDRSDNRETWLNSFPLSVKTENTFETFSTVESVISKLNSGVYPEIIFLDYFIKNDYGSSVINWFLNKNIKSTLMIAHSSMDRANDGMIKLGAHMKLPKDKHVKTTESIENLIKSSEDLVNLIKTNLK